MEKTVFIILSSICLILALLMRTSSGCYCVRYPTCCCPGNIPSCCGNHRSSTDNVVEFPIDNDKNRGYFYKSFSTIIEVTVRVETGYYQGKLIDELENFRSVQTYLCREILKVLYRNRGNPTDGFDGLCEIRSMYRLTSHLDISFDISIPQTSLLKCNIYISRTILEERIESIMREHVWLREFGKIKFAMVTVRRVGKIESAVTVHGHMDCSKVPYMCPGYQFQMDVRYVREYATLLCQKLLEQIKQDTDSSSIFTGCWAWFVDYNSAIPRVNVHLFFDWDYASRKGGLSYILERTKIIMSRNAGLIIVNSIKRYYISYYRRVSVEGILWKNDQPAMMDLSFLHSTSQTYKKVEMDLREEMRMYIDPPFLTLSNLLVPSVGGFNIKTIKKEKRQVKLEGYVLIHQKYFENILHCQLSVNCSRKLQDDWEIRQPEFQIVALTLSGLHNAKNREMSFTGTVWLHGLFILNENEFTNTKDILVKQISEESNRTLLQHFEHVDNLFCHQIQEIRVESLIEEKERVLVKGVLKLKETVTSSIERFLLYDIQRQLDECVSQYNILSVIFK